jgi:hypothetical protein
MLTTRQTNQDAANALAFLQPTKASTHERNHLSPDLQKNSRLRAKCC